MSHPFYVPLTEEERIESENDVVPLDQAGHVYKPEFLKEVYEQTGLATPWSGDPSRPNNIKENN